MHHPTLNAFLNGGAAIFLLLGYFFIRRRQITLHRVSMLTACVLSVIFLISYLIYHFHHGSTRFPGQGTVRSVYFFILITHTVLAVVIVPMILKTLYHTVRNDFTKHMRLARVTFPLWLYVSVTGVVVYVMLYQIKH